MIKLVLSVTFATAVIASSAFGKPSKSSTKTTTAPARDWERYLISAPEVVIPEVIVRTGSSGSTLFRLSINPKDGTVTEVKVRWSTATKKLNAIYIMNFFQWRFQPGTITSVEIERGIRITNSQTIYH
jgi:hypothetical protein